MGARDAIDPGIKVDFPGHLAPPLYGKPSPGRYRTLSRYMAGFDLVLTYNWGSMDAVGARRLFPRGCPPLIHHEDGFNADETERLNWKRNGFRRLMLPTAKALVVPSARLEGIARSVWKQPDSRVVRIPNGIDTAAYQAPCAPDAIPGFVRREGEVVIGTLAGLRGVKNLRRLVRVVATLPPHVRLVIVGEGEERAAIVAEAETLGISGRMIMAGFLSHPERFMGLFDIFALSSDSEQFPIALIEAMAAGLPAVSTDVGDVRTMLPDACQAGIVKPADEGGFSTALAALVSDPALRTRLGAANQVRAVEQFDERAMITRYAALYGIGMDAA